MDEMSEYVNATATLGGSVHEVSRKLIRHSENLHALTSRLRTLFELFSRGDELLRIVQDYSRNLQNDINRVRGSLHVYEEIIEATNERLRQVQERLEAILDLINNIQTNASSFLDAAQSLAHIAKNTEIKAYHAKKEGKGLAIIAKECLALAKLAQLPFTDFGSLLQGLKDAAEPLILELERIIKLSKHSQILLQKSFRSLTTINQTTLSLQQIITRAEHNSMTYKRMKKDATRDLDLLNKQTLTSLSTIDDMSARCTQVVSLSEILASVDGLYQTIDQDSDKLTAYTISHLGRQCHYFFNENLRVIRQLSLAKAPPLFPQQTLHDIQNMAHQINAIGASFADIAEHRENLGSGMSDIIQLVQGIQKFLEETDTIFQHLHSLGDDLHAKINKTEQLVAETSRIFIKIKTLSVYAKIEEGRSSLYQRLLSSIIVDFIQLEKKTEQAFSQIAPQLAEVKKNAHFLQRMKSETQALTVTYPDYSKIKLFLDDIVRVFKEEEEQVVHIVKAAEDLMAGNTLVSNGWQKYKEGIGRLSDTLSLLRMSQEPPVSMAVISKKSATLKTNLSDDPMTLRPDLRTDMTSLKVINNFSSGLFQFGEGVDIIPGLCEDYSLSTDGLTYTFTIREKVKYQDGNRLGLGDIRNAFIKALQGPNANFFEMIIGARDVIEGNTSFLAGVKVISNRQLECKLEYPFLPLLANLAANIADPYVDASLPVGTGPFRLVSWDKGTAITLTANEHYYAGRPNIDRLVFSIIPDEMAAYERFCADKLDVFQATDKVIDKLKHDKSSILFTIPELSVQYFCMNCRIPPFDNIFVRRAIAHAIDRERLVKELLPNNALAAKGIFPPSMKVYNKALKGYDYNIRKAKELLNTAGYKNGLPDSYPFDVSNTPSSLNRAEFIKKNLATIGIKVDIKPESGHDLMEKRYSGKSMLSFSGWISDNGDPDTFLYPLFHSSSFGRSGNTSFLSLPEIDRAIDKARKIRNVEQRILLYRQIEEKILEESPAVFLFHRVQTVAVKKGVLGLKPHPLSLIKAQHALLSQEDFSHLNNTNEQKHDTYDVSTHVGIAAR